MSNNNGYDNLVQGYTKKKLYDLLPAVYRQRDARIGKPLEGLIEILAKHVSMIEKDIGGLYDNWFIETCDEWVTSYLADLVGARSLRASRVSSLSTTTEVSQRAYVANTIAYRRRKGTLSMLEQLALDITQWHPRAVEFFQLLDTTQNINHVRITNYRTPDLRKTANVDLLDTPFDTIAHTLEVRRISSKRGYYNVQNIGLFLWRLQAFPSQNTYAFPHLEPGKTVTTHFSFSPFGFEIPLFNKPEEELGIANIASEINLPLPILRRTLLDKPAEFYGKERSIFVRVRYDGKTNFRDISLDEIEICKMGKDKKSGNDKWVKPSEGKVAIDPETGRIALSADATEVMVSFYFGFSAKIGGGTYKRPRLPFDTKSSVYRISKKGGLETSYTTIRAAIDAWGENSKNKIERTVVFEIDDTEVYDEDLVLYLPVGCSAAIVASNEKRPILRSISVRGETGSKLTLDGLWFINNNSNNNNNNKNPSIEPIIKVNPGDMASLTIRHCTLLPGRSSDDKDKTKVAAGVQSYMRRHLCLLNDISSNDSQRAHLLKFLKRNFASWLPDDPSSADIKVEMKAGIEYITITIREQQQEEEEGDARFSSKNVKGSMKIEIWSEKTERDEYAAHLNIIDENGVMHENVYEFIVSSDSNGNESLYVKGGNNSLIVSLDRSISGSIQILDSLIFSWDRISEEEDDNDRDILIEFLKANFYLPWLTPETQFKVEDTDSDGLIDLLSASKHDDESADDNKLLSITLENKNSAVLLIKDGEKTRRVEFLVSDRRVYVQTDAHVSATDSIIDGKGVNEAIQAHSASIENATVFGKVRVNRLNLASNTIFTDRVLSTITQEGCVRYSYIPPDSVTPRRYMCQPDGASKQSSNIHPIFTSVDYGDPGYAQLHRNIAPEIFEGADNKAEMGAFNHLLQPQRIDDLRTSLDEYLRFGLEVGVFLVT
ncbi:MAG: hypothetical protein M3M89_02830 [Thermoproteota archaeon]|nr:hypothetical protein [Thermoproteota archaeon]